MVTPHQARTRVKGSSKKTGQEAPGVDLGVDERRKALADSRKVRAVVDELKRRIVPGVNNNGTWERYGVLVLMDMHGVIGLVSKAMHPCTSCFYRRVAVYHYVTKSREDFEAKLKRGGGAGITRSLDLFDQVMSGAMGSCPYACSPNS